MNEQLEKNTQKKFLMYDLCGRDNRRFSPYCWRTRLAFAHKNVELHCESTLFTEIAAIATAHKPHDLNQRNSISLPTVVIDGQYVTDSATIAQWLDHNFTAQTPLFGHDSAVGLTCLLQNWIDTVVHPSIARLIVKDIADHLDERDLAHFTSTREKRFGEPLEVVQLQARTSVDAFRRSLSPLRTAIAQTPWFGGSSPSYADYIVFGALQWARLTSDFRLLEAQDPLTGWRNRVASLYDGLGDSQQHYY